MVILKRVTESVGHVESLKSLLKFYSKNPENWDKEWSVNPYYLVDLKKYGAGNCVCGHAIRYQFQFLNTVTGRKFPVGSVCVHLLNLSKFDDVVDKLERINQMAIQELDHSLSPTVFVKKYKKFYTPQNIDSLIDSIGDLGISKFQLNLYKDSYNKRKLDDYTARNMKEVIEVLYNKAKEVIEDIESKSKPVTQDQVQDIVNDSAEEMLKFAKAKQNRLPF